MPRSFAVSSFLLSYPRGAVFALVLAILAGSGCSTESRMTATAADPTARAAQCLANGTPAEKAAVVAEIKAHADRYEPPALYALAAALFARGAKEESVFWLYAGQLRARGDTRLWNEESAGDAVDALNQRYGLSVIDYAFNDVAKLGDTLQAVAAWDAKTPRHYDRRWPAWRTSAGAASEPLPVTIPAAQWEVSDRNTRAKYLLDFRRATGGDADEYFRDPQLVALANAARRGDCASVDALIASGAKVNQPGKDGMTVLWFPFRAYNKAGYRRLLDHGADPTLPLGRWKDSVLAAAAARNDPAYLALILDHGVSPDATTPDSSLPMIFKAVVPGALPSLKLLLARGARLDPRDRLHNTPLLAAATLNQYEQVAALIEAGADFRLKNDQGHDLAYFLYNGAMSVERRQRRAEVVARLMAKGVSLPLALDDRDHPSIRTFADAAAAQSDRSVLNRR